MKNRGKRLRALRTGALFVAGLAAFIGLLVLASLIGSDPFVLAD